MTHEDNVNAARSVLEERALQYARMRAFGAELHHNGSVIHIQQSERKTRADQLMVRMGEAADALLFELTLAELPAKPVPPASRLIRECHGGDGGDGDDIPF
jgi:hypothetical protein